MRLTIESTTSEPRYSVKESLEVPYDDLELDEVLALVRELLQGFGYELQADEDYTI